MMCRSISTMVAVPPPNVEFPYQPNADANAASVGRRTVGTIGAAMAKNREVSRATGQHVRRNMSALQIRTKVWLECDGAFVFGDGGLELLEEIQRLRSLTKAAEAVGWSY